MVCWGSSISVGHRKRLNKLIKKASSVLERPPDPVEVVGDRTMLDKLSSMMETVFHSLQDTNITEQLLQ